MQSAIFGLLAMLLVLSAPVAPARGSREPRNGTWVEVDGTIYGCLPDETGPVGEAKGYSRAVTSGDYRAETLDQLLQALQRARPGETVFVPAHVELDFTGLVYAENFVLHVPEGVTLGSSRGSPGSSGALLKSDAFQTSPLIQADGPGVRITGLRIKGPDPERRLEHWKRSFGKPYEEERGDLSKQQYFYLLPAARGISTQFDSLEVDNCELSGWSQAAIFLAAGQRHHLHHNNIHNNQRHGLGYGISHGTAFSLIEYNRFERNRHSIAGTGQAPSGYIARHNVEGWGVRSATTSTCMEAATGRTARRWPARGSRSTTIPSWEAIGPSGSGAGRRNTPGSTATGSLGIKDPARR